MHYASTKCRVDSLLHEHNILRLLLIGLALIDHDRAIYLSFLKCTPNAG